MEECHVLVDKAREVYGLNVGFEAVESLRRVLPVDSGKGNVGKPWDKRVAVDTDHFGPWESSVIIGCKIYQFQSVLECHTSDRTNEQVVGDVWRYNIAGARS